MSTDILKFLGIESLVFEYENGKTSSLVLEYFTDENDFAVFSSLPLSENGKVRIETFGRNLIFDCETSEIRNSLGEYKITFSEPLPKAILEKIAEYRALKIIAEKRREERFEVGLKKTDDFFLARPDQYLIYLKDRKIRCILNNVSFHGALITGETSALKINENIVQLAVRFVNPIETVLQPAVVARIELCTKELARYSLKFIEPFSTSWQQRVENFSMNF